MSTIGQRAIVIGAGMGGLTAARALAPYFEHVVVIERDRLPTDPSTRHGVPQAKHVHALLAGGQRALAELFSKFESDLTSAGAVPVRVGFDIRMERPGYDPFPKRDLGFDSYALSRALIEFLTRARLDAHVNVEIRQRARVERLIADERRTITGVEYVDADGKRTALDAQLVIEASGRGDLTLAVLDSLALPRPPATTIGVDIAYASAIYEIPHDAPDDWKGVFHLPMPRSSRGALLLPLEGRRWILTGAAVVARVMALQATIRRATRRGSSRSFRAFERRRSTTRFDPPSAWATSSATVFRRVFTATTSGSRRSRPASCCSATPCAGSTRSGARE